MHSFQVDRLWAPPAWTGLKPHQVQRTSRYKIFFIIGLALLFITTYRTLSSTSTGQSISVASSWGRGSSSHRLPSYITPTKDPEVLSVNLLDFPCYILNANKTKQEFLERGNAARKRLLNAGFKEVYLVEGVENHLKKPYAVAMGHALIVKQALRHNEIYSPHEFRPFLIFEDDINFNDGFDPILKYPADADAVYVSMENLGSVLSGGTKLKHWKQGVFWTRHPTLHNIARIFNMLTTHGTLVMTERFAQNWGTCAFEGAVRNKHFDTIVGLTQRWYNVYCQRSPIFWQSAKERSQRWQLTGQEIHGVEDIPLVDPKDRPESIAMEMAEYEVKGMKDIDFETERGQWADHWHRHKIDATQLDKQPFNEKYRDRINGGVPKFGNDENVPDDLRKASQQQSGKKKPQPKRIGNS